MDKEREKFILEFKNICLAEPITTKGQQALEKILCMTEDDFFDNIYVEPFSDYKQNIQNEKLEELDSDIESNIAVTKYQLEIELADLENRELQFERSIKELENYLYIIKGVAGSGKSTYLHYLLRQIDKNIDVHIYNFEQVKRSGSFMWVSFDFSQVFQDNVYKFISMLIIEISRILSRNVKNDNEYEHVSYIKCIVDEYKKYFQVHEYDLENNNLKEPNIDVKEQQELFGILNNYADSKIDYREFSKSLYNKLAENTNIENRGIHLKYLFGFIIRLYFCIFKITSKKQLCIIDNIEYFVEHDKQNPIQYIDLVTIIQGCIDAAIEMREMVQAIKNVGEYEAFYSFLIVTRETTASTTLHCLEHYDDFQKRNEIDISKWFSTEKIVANKLFYFDYRGFQFDDNNYLECYKNVLCDFSVYQLGMNSVVSKMYKNSHRRNFECVPDAIALRPLSEIKYFNKMWKIADSGEVEKSSLKTLCRKYILRILLDNVQRQKYFDNLLVENLDLPFNCRTLFYRRRILKSKLHDEETSYARKIATVLHRFALCNGNESYISLPRIIKTILLPIHRQNVKLEGHFLTQLKNLAKIIYWMNETRAEDTNWTSLICMKYDSRKKYDDKELYSIMCELWQQYSNNEIDIDDTADFGIKITEAGSLFAKFIADFEYFASRYLTGEPPLFSPENTKTILVDGEKSFRAVEIIKIVSQKAFECVDEIIKKDKNFISDVLVQSGRQTDFSIMYNREYSWLYKETNNDKELSHPYRILAQHRGYIDNYISYVSKYVPEDSFASLEEKQEFVKKLENQRGLYNKKIMDINSQYPGYFDERTL